MKIGMNMHLYNSEVTPADFKDIEAMKKVGFDGIEIFLAEPDKNNLKELAPFLKDLGMECLGCLGVGPEANPASPDASIRQAGLEAIKRSIDALQSVNGVNLCGPYHSAFATFSRNAPQEDEYKYSADTLREAAEYAAQANITLSPEALNRFECYLANTMSQLKKLVQLVDHPNLGGMYDPHHANIEEKSQKQAILDIEPVLTYVHISENDRGTPGSGLVQWDEVFSTLKSVNYEGWMTIEAFSRTNEDFSNAINVWRQYDPREEMMTEGYAFVQKMLAKHY